MDFDGQAPEAPTTIGDVADFLVENMEEVEGEPQEPEESDNSAADENPDEGGDPDQGEDEGESEEDELEDKPKPEPTSRKFKVPVKGDDGADQEVEVDEKELIAGYQRHSRFTQLSQGLAERERQAAEVVTRQLNEGRQHFVQEAQKARQAVLMLAGLRSEHDMADLAIRDPGAWVQERNRTEQVQRVLNQLDQSVQQQMAEAQQHQEAAQRQALQRAWVELEKDGMDRPKLANIFQGIAKTYGVEEEKFAQINDPRLVKIMRDAMAYQDLKNKTVPAKKPASKLPAARQTVQETPSSKRLESRFKSGRAKVGDLASFIMQTSKG